MFDTIANFLNGIMAALRNIAGFKLAIPNPFDKGYEEDLPDKLNPFDDEGSSSGGTWGDVRKITDPEVIGATFLAEGSPAWIGQWQGTPLENKHGGVDFRGNQGTRVYMPYDGNVIWTKFYSDSGRYGHAFIATLGDNTEYYSGHLQDMKVHVGDTLKAGQQVGETNQLNHTHIQLKREGQPIDFLKYREEHP